MKAARSASVKCLKRNLVVSSAVKAALGIGTPSLCANEECEKSSALHVPHDHQKERRQQHGSQGKEQVGEPEPDHLVPDHLRQFGLRAGSVIRIAMVEA